MAPQMTHVSHPELFVAVDNYLDFKYPGYKKDRQRFIKGQMGLMEGTQFLASLMQKVKDSKYGAGWSGGNDLIGQIGNQYVALVGSSKKSGGSSGGYSAPLNAHLAGESVGANYGDGGSSAYGTSILAHGYLPSNNAGMSRLNSGGEWAGQIQYTIDVADDDDDEDEEDWSDEAEVFNCALSLLSSATVIKNSHPIFKRVAEDEAAYPATLNTIEELLTMLEGARSAIWSCREVIDCAIRELDERAEEGKGKEVEGR